jgi:Rrf2 family protein
MFRESHVMKLSRKSDYALRALVTLAGRGTLGHMSIRELAELNDVPRRFLEQIMLELKAKGIVRSIAGRVGGFELAQPPEQITMGRMLLDIRNYTARRMDEATLASIAAGSPVARMEVFNPEFEFAEGI